MIHHPIPYHTHTIPSLAIYPPIPYYTIPYLDANEYNEKPHPFIDDPNITFPFSANTDISPIYIYITEREREKAVKKDRLLTRMN
jgi:hypothetical protein